MASRAARARGYSMIELVTGAVIVSTILAVGFMWWMRVMERARAGPVVDYLTTLRAAQRNYLQADLRPPQWLPRTSYTNDLLLLDVRLPDSISGWTGPNQTLSGSQGMATFTRRSGWYRDQQLGIQYRLGTLCGTFEPYLPLSACAAD